MKLLYLSCHEILEYDEIKLFLELGIDVFSYGAYLNPDNPGSGKREPLPLKQDPQLVELAKYSTKERLLPDLVEPFDVVYIMHNPQWVANNWELIKDKVVIWRTIGQSTRQVEEGLAPFRSAGLKVVRYSPREQTIPSFIGEDAMIRFYKDPDEFKGWNGNIGQVVSLCQSMAKRDHFCNFEFYKHIMSGFPWRIFGPENDWAGLNNGGFVSYDKLKEVLRQSRCYFYTGTFPASYTLNFIEAWMTGIPVVAIGPKRGNASFFEGQDTYEIPDLIENGVNGFVSDDEDDLTSYILSMLSVKDYAREIGEAGRRSAIEYFGKKKIKKQWKQFFRRL